MNKILHILLLFTVVTLGGVTKVSAVTPTPTPNITPIPIEEEFVVAQQLHVDSSWDAIVIQLLQEEGLLDNTTMHYEGTYNISQNTSGNFSGNYSGILTGMYLGEQWEIEYTSDMETVNFSQEDNKTLIWNLKSKGEWRNGTLKGKKFNDTGTLIEKSDNTAELGLKIKTDGVENSTLKNISVKKVKKYGKLLVEGISNETIGGKKYNNSKFYINLDQEKKKFRSYLRINKSHILFTNGGNFTVENGNGSISFDLNFSFIPTTEIIDNMTGTPVVNESTQNILAEDYMNFNLDDPYNITITRVVNNQVVYSANGTLTGDPKQTIPINWTPTDMGDYILRSDANTITEDKIVQVINQKVISPVPELSTVALTSTDLLGLLGLTRL
ncbi:hypothetical protein METP2_03608 [Methanosarcinales archaeon]|nr:hypothetical protein [Candidatus Methanoperedens sp.]CAG1004971.1 hypothetical protein METP2_03608 [Methanosarcinales archaeon]